MKKIIKTIQKICDSIKRKMIYKRNFLRPKSLAPVKDINNSSSIMLAKAMYNKDNLNIALTGGYGAGKSSIIKSYYAGIKGFFRKRLCVKPIFISLGMLGIDFSSYEKNDSSGNKNNKDVFCQEIEKSIIQQIIYKESKDKLPDSQINRPSKTSIKSILKVFFVVVLLFIFIIFIKENNYGIDDFFNIYSIFNFKEDFVKIQNNEEINNLSLKIIIILLSGILLFIVAKILKGIIKQIDNIGLKLKFGQAEIEMGKSKSESLINKYMDELVYFFSKTNYSVVVIEDLDRFLDNPQIRDRVIIIFQKLKELNQVLNQSNQINRKIRFIYLVKDDLFTESRERIKFFDVIIPVIPIVSNYNSYAELRNTFYEYEEIDDKLLQDISPFVVEKRQIINMYNEYKLYREEICGNEIDSSKLLAIVALKNLRPYVYEELINDKGLLYVILNSKKDLVRRKIEILEKRIDYNKNLVKIYEEEALKDSKELKKIALYSLKNQSAQRINEPSISEEKFLSEEIDSNYLKDNSIFIQDMNNHQYIAYNERQIFKDIGGKEGFIERLRRIEEIRDLDIKKIAGENSIYNDEIRKAKLLPLKELIDNDDNSDNNDYLIDDKFINNLLLNGFIDENYKDYMYKFLTSDKFSKNDQEYMSNVRQGNYIDYDCIINHPRNVIDELDEEYFLNTNVLTFDIVKELCSQKEDKKNKKREYLIKNLSQNDIGMQEFICDYYEHFGIKLTSVLLACIDKYDNESVCNLLNACPDYKDDFITVIRKEKHELLDNEIIMQYIKDYVEEIKDYIKWCEEFNTNEKKFLLKLDPEFKNMEIKNKEFTDFIIENGLYYPNMFMLKQIFHFYKINPSFVEIRALSEIEHDKRLAKVKAKINNKRIEFLNECYFTQKQNENDVDDIVNCIKNWNLPIDIINEMINNLPKRVDIEDFNKDITNLILKFDKINPSLYNYYKVYQINDYTLNEDIIHNMELNVDSMIKSNKNELDEMEKAKDKAKDKDEEKDEEKAKVKIKAKVKNEEKDEEYVHFKEIIAKNDQINIETYKKLIPHLNFVLNTIVSGEINPDRLYVLVDNDMIKLDRNNFQVVCIDIPTKVGRLIRNNINKFIDMIPIEELTEEVVESIMTYNIPYKDKIRIANRIELQLLNKNSLQYLAQEYRKYRNYKLSDEIIDKIVSSNIPQDIRIDFINKLNVYNKDIMDKYLEWLGKPYSYVEQYGVKQSFSLPRTDNNMELVDTLNDLNYNITVLRKRNKIIIYNKKN